MNVKSLHLLANLFRCILRAEFFDIFHRMTNFFTKRKKHQQQEEENAQHMFTPRRTVCMPTHNHTFHNQFPIGMGKLNRERKEKRWFDESKLNLCVYIISIKNF